jgi:hypothetical protein
MSQVQDGKWYKGSVVDQSIAETKNGPALILNVRVPGLEGEEPKVWMALRGQHLDKTYKALGIIGFDDPDLRKLHPEHAEHVSLKGRAIEVSPKVTAKATYWNASLRKFENKSSSLADLDDSFDLEYARSAYEASKVDPPF